MEGKLLGEVVKVFGNFLAFDMFNNRIKVNDEVQYILDGEQKTGIVNFVSPNNMIRINSLIGEVRRKGNNVVKLKR